jgi:hypothetical protein
VTAAIFHRSVKKPVENVPLRQPNYAFRNGFVMFCTQFQQIHLG